MSDRLDEISTQDVGGSIAPNGAGSARISDLITALGEPLIHGGDYFRRLVDTLPAAIYTSDISGRITYFNEAAAELWGRRPPLGESEWCGSWKLFWSDGRPMPHHECPMAIAVKEKRAVRGMEAWAERPDGVRVPFIPYPTPFYDSAGVLMGFVNLLVDITDRKRGEDAMQRLAAIVENSDDAIVSKDLNGVITSWNVGAERIFGYLAEEVIGKPITILIPPEHQQEEQTIIERIRRGQRIDHFDTVRQRKHGSLIHVSLVISPIRDAQGRIVGASKIARDITDRKRAEAQIVNLAREAEHRTKNVLATVQAILRLSEAATPEALKAVIEGRIQALAKAHASVIQSRGAGANLKSLVARELSPYYQSGDERAAIDGPQVLLDPDLAQTVAIVLHELATNAAKYGSLSNRQGRVEVSWTWSADGRLLLRWIETGGPAIQPATKRGFGTKIIENVVGGQLDGSVRFDWRTEGLACELLLPVGSSQ